MGQEEESLLELSDELSGGNGGISARGGFDEIPPRRLVELGLEVLEVWEKFQEV